MDKYEKLFNVKDLKDKFPFNQTLEICLKAVSQNGFALQYVKDQTLEICLKAVSQDGRALQYVKNQTPEICLKAVSENRNVFRYCDREVLDKALLNSQETPSEESSENTQQTPSENTQQTPEEPLIKQQEQNKTQTNNLTNMIKSIIKNSVLSQENKLKMIKLLINSQ